MSGAVREARMEEDQRAERAAGGKREVRWSARRKEELAAARRVARPARPRVGPARGADRGLA